MKYLNLGCGNRYLPEWTNVDFDKTAPSVISCDLSKKFPFADNEFDVIYSSHVLEHFSKDKGKDFIRECYRVLKPKGIIRIVVPNLEQIAKEYLLNLNNAANGDTNAQDNYEWILLEMYDQTIRNESGGLMSKYWQQSKISNEEYIIQRLGSEFIEFRKKIVGIKLQPKKRKFLQPSFKHKLVNWLLNDKDAVNLYNVAKFRSSGEIHQWMYDRYSLHKLLNDEKFTGIIKVDAFSSEIPNWKQNMWLDVEEGKVRKPDSLFIEAIK